MKSKIFLIGFSLLISVVSYSQEDTTYFSYDSTYVYDSTYNYESGEYEGYEEESDAYSTSSYNIQDPAKLPVTQKNKDTRYQKHNFDKTKWKEIVGETNYIEEKEKAKEKEKEEEKKSSEFDTGGSSVWSPALFKFIGFVLIFIFAILVLYLLVKSAFADDSIDRKTNGADSLLADVQHIDEVSDQDIDSLLKQALASGDFRAAVRLYYIRLLKHLHTTKFIAWKKNKTNRDYATELSETIFVVDFRKITLAYEIIWYGERTPSSHEFEVLQRNFSELHDKTVSELA